MTTDHGSRPIPVLWLCGPSGVGKSTVGFEIFRLLGRAGVRAAFLDADQLGLCYPAAEDDPENYRVKARNLAAVLPLFQAAGAQCLVFAGGVHTLDTVRTYTDLLAGVPITLCRLRVDRDELRARIAGRGWFTHLADLIVSEADALDRTGFADLCVDSGGLSVAETARLVCERAGGWPRLAPAGPPEAPAPVEPPGSRAGTGGGGDGPPVPFLWLAGARGVGKSTVGWEVFSQVQQDGIKAAYVDLQQIGFRLSAPDGDPGDPGDHRLRARNLAAMWPVFRAAGARCLIVSGGVAEHDVVRMYAVALPGTALTVCRLRAAPERLAERITLRGAGAGPAIPGDELKGRPVAELRRVAREAVREGEKLERAGIGELCVDTDGRTPGEAARLVRDRAGGAGGRPWPASAGISRAARPATRSASG